MQLLYRVVPRGALSSCYSLLRHCCTPLHALTQVKHNYCTGLCLEELCQAAIACPDTAAPLICQLLEVIPGLSLSSHGLLDLQQHLPLKAVGACLLLPSEVTGELH